MAEIDAINYIYDHAGKKTQDRACLTDSFAAVQKISASDGLSSREMRKLVKVLCENKLPAEVAIDLIKCFVPQSKISNKNLLDLLRWFFTSHSHHTLSQNVEKKFLHWLTGIAYFELCKVGLIDRYYHSFFFLLEENHLEAAVCGLLCVISKPEDARRWLVVQILDIQKLYGQKHHTNALLSLLKTYKSDVVPESIPFATFYYQSVFSENLEKAHQRNLVSKDVNDCKLNELSWKPHHFADKKSRALQRLIPAVGTTVNRFSLEGGSYSVLECNNMAALGARISELQTPDQVMALLTNKGGHYLIAFGDSSFQNRFSSNLYHTLCKVFLYGVEPYSKEEKAFLLKSIYYFEEFMFHGIKVVSQFLRQYLMAWDGEECQSEIFKLLEYITINTEEDRWEDIFRPLRMIFRISYAPCRNLMIDTMWKLVQNILISRDRDFPRFGNEYYETDVVQSVQSICSFVNELITEGLTWSKGEKDCRMLMSTALTFYENCQAAILSVEFPGFVLMPPALVYKCLFSISRVCVARLCSLLIRAQIDMVQRLYMYGIVEDYGILIERLSVYIMDAYRMFWSSQNFMDEKESYIFQDKTYLTIARQLKEAYNVDCIFGVHNSITFAESRYYENSAVALKSVGELRELVESMVNRF